MSAVGGASGERGGGRASAIHIAREFAGRSRNFVGQHFWVRGSFVSTVGRDEEVIRRSIQRQENEDRKQDQLKFG